MALQWCLWFCKVWDIHWFHPHFGRLFLWLYPRLRWGELLDLQCAFRTLGLRYFRCSLLRFMVYNHRYLPEASVFFLICAVVSILVALLLLLWDRRTGGKLRVRGKPSAGSVHPVTPSGHSIHSNHCSKGRFGVAVGSDVTI